jgi:hypothetical protein
MFRSNQSPIPIANSSPSTRLLSTTPPDDKLMLVDEERRSSLESIEPLPNYEHQHTPYSRSRTRSASSLMWCRLCPYFHVSLTRHFRRTGLIIILSGIVNIILCTYYAYIDANQKHYGADDWQSCIVYGEESLAALGYNTRFSLAAAAAGQQTLIFSLLATVTLYRALSHPEWLVSTLAFVFYAFIGCFCYFSFSPAIPFPTSLCANVFTLMFFVKPSMYDGVILTSSPSSVDPNMDVTMDVTMDPNPDNNPDNYPDNNLERGGGTTSEPSVCNSAYNYNIFFMIIQYLSITCVAILFFIGCLAESRRRKIGLIADQTAATPASSTRGHGNAFSNTLVGISFANWPTLRSTNLPMFLAMIEFSGFFAMLYGKNLCAWTALQSARNLTSEILPTFFPFAAGGLDIVTILFVVSAMAVIRGTTRQRVSAFRLAACTSFLHVVLSWPSIVAGWKFMQVQGFWSDNCNDYFMGSGTWFKPDELNQERYCLAVRTAMIGQLVTFVSMHLSVVACVRCYLANRDQPLELFDPNPQASEAARLLFNENVVVSR